MNFIEFIGFIISLGALVFIYIKRVREERARMKDPEYYAQKQRQQEEALKELYKTFHIKTDDDEEEEEEVKVVKKTISPPPRLPQARRPIESNKPLSTIENREFKTSFDYLKKDSQYLPAKENAPKYEVVRNYRDSRGRKMLHQLHAQREMLVIKEIFDKPLALRDLDDHDRK